MLIVSDVDDCLVPLIETTIQRFERRTGGVFDRTRFNGYNLRNYLSQYELDMFNEIWHDPNLYDGLEPIKGAVQALKGLVDDKHEVCMATRYDVHGSKKRWVQKFLPFLDIKNYFVTERKDLIACDFMIEDCIETLVACKPSVYRICITQPWNTMGDYYDDVHGIYRVANITKACKVVKELARKEGELIF